MAARLQIRLYNTDGTLREVMDSWRSVSLQLRLNDFSTHEIHLDESRGELTWPKDTIVRVLRSDPAQNLDWYTEYEGFHRTPQHEITEGGNRLFTSYGRSLEDLLHRRYVLYGGASPQSYKGPLSGGIVGLPADDIMKSYVRENIGELADGPLRLRPGRIPNWITAADIGQAPRWSGERAFKNLLDVIQEVGRSMEDTMTAVDFKVTLAAMVPPTFLFTTSYPLMGQDLTTTVPPLVFSDVNDNITNVTYTRSATEEVTVVVSLGTGLGLHRAAGSVFNFSAVAESPWNYIETVRDFSSMSEETALVKAAQQILNAQGAQESFKFTPRQTNLAVYGRDYRLGDRVYVQLGSIRRAKRLVGVNITSSGDGAEQLTFEFGDYIATGANPFVSALRNISSRMNHIEFEGDL
jgi:hypothetical protein